MSRQWRACLFVLLLSTLLSASTVSRAPHGAAFARDASAEESIGAGLWGNMPLYFTENQGQVDEQVAYYVQGRDKTLYFTADGITFVLTDGSVEDRTSEDPWHVQRAEQGLQSKAGQPHAVRRWVLKLDFVDANHDVQPIGEDPTPTVVSYFKGPAEEWTTGVRTYSTLVYRDLWPGIDLVYSGTANALKYQFVVQPGADPARIRLAYRGATAIRVNEAGQLEVSTDMRSFHDETPYAYQEGEGGQQTPVAVTYALREDTDAHAYGFTVGAYDRRRPLVLDPAVVVYCGFIGGSAFDEGRGIAVDSAGNAYVAGATRSLDFPSTTGVFDMTFGGGTCGTEPYTEPCLDAFVAKVKADGTGLAYCAYLGGTGHDRALDIAVDQANNAHLHGYTESSEIQGFPVTVGPDLAYNGGGDAFVAKVNSDATSLDYCGYIGGGGEEGWDQGGIALDGAGNAYVTGYTPSNETSFPTVIGPDLTYNGGWYDAFVAKVKTDGSGLDYCGYIGGNGADYGWDITVDDSGNAYVSGSTESSETQGFPVTVGPDLQYNGDPYDAFVAKVKVDGTGLVYCGYIGGQGEDSGEGGIAIDGAGKVYVTGFTTSSETSFPVITGPDLTYNGGWCDAFVAKVKADGTGLDYCGYIGGSGMDYGRGIAVGLGGSCHIAGWTASAQDFPVSVGPDLTHNGGFGDAFVARVKPNGTGLDYCGYVGGEGMDMGCGIAVDYASNTYVTGCTWSDESTFPVAVGPDLTFNGGLGDAFVAKVGRAMPMPRPTPTRRPTPTPRPTPTRRPAP